MDDGLRRMLGGDRNRVEEVEEYIGEFVEELIGEFVEELIGEFVERG